MGEGWENPDRRSGEPEYFKKALSDFMFDVASAGAIRHLTDRGYTVNQIVKKLDFPTPLDRVQKVVWKHLLDTGVLSLEEPGGTGQEKYAYVADYDEFGRKSFRRVMVSEGNPGTIDWRESHFSKKNEGDFAEFLERKCTENGEEQSYVSCKFGLYSRREPEGFEKVTGLLEPAQRDYILGIPWERRIVYHRLNPCMRAIAGRLWKEKGCIGACYFIKTREKIVVEG